MIDLQRTTIVIDKVLDGMKFKNGTVVVKDTASIFKAENVRFEAICLYDENMKSLGYCTEQSWISPNFTNEDWLGQMTLNEKAKWLADNIGFTIHKSKTGVSTFIEESTTDYWKKWLREEHYG